MAEDNKQDSKKQQETEATKNAAVTAAKMYGGPIGAGVNLASKTKLGNAVLNKGAEALNKQNPALGKLTNALNKGNSDLVHKADSANNTGDSNNKNDNSSNSVNTGSSSKSSGGSALSSLGSKKADSGKNDDNDSEAIFEGDFSSQALGFIKKHWIKITGIFNRLHIVACSC